MQVTTFRLENAEFITLGLTAYGAIDARFNLPILEAYAIHHSKIEMDNSYHMDKGYEQPNYEIANDFVTLKSFGHCIFGSHTGVLMLYHAGIKDYSLLFSHTIRDWSSGYFHFTVWQPKMYTNIWGGFGGLNSINMVMYPQ